MSNREATTRTVDSGVAFSDVIQNGDGAKLPSFEDYARYFHTYRPDHLRAITTEPAYDGEQEVSEDELSLDDVQRSLADTALAATGHLNLFQTAYYSGMATLIGKMPGTTSKEELLELDRQQKEKFAADENDGFLTSRIKAIRRNKYQIYSWAPVAIMGAAALEAYAMRSMGYVSFFGDHHGAVQQPGLSLHYRLLDVEQPAGSGDYASNYGDYAALVYPTDYSDSGSASSDYFVAPSDAYYNMTDGRGNGDSLSATNMRINQGVYDPASTYPIQYPGTMGMIDGPGAPTFNESTDIAGAVGTNQIANELATNPNAHIEHEGFSLGSVGARKAVEPFEDANGNLPSSIHLTVDGDPEVQGHGFFGSGVSQLVAPFEQAAGIDPTLKHLPVGTTVNTSQNDLWGNGANQSIAVNALQGLDIPYAHTIEDPCKPHASWVDNNGLHINMYDVGVHPLTQMIEGQNGQPVAPGFNAMFNDALPVNDNVNEGDPRPTPNAYATVQDFAVGVNQSTNSQIGNVLVGMLPQGDTQLLQDGLNIANNGGGPQDIPNLMNDVSQFLGDLFGGRGGGGYGLGGQALRSQFGYGGAPSYYRPHLPPAPYATYHRTYEVLPPPPPPPPPPVRHYSPPVYHSPYVPGPHHYDRIPSHNFSAPVYHPRPAYVPAPHPPMRLPHFQRYASAMPRLVGHLMGGSHRGGYFRHR